MIYITGDCHDDFRRFNTGMIKIADYGIRSNERGVK